MPIIQVQLLAGRPAERIDALIGSLTDAVARTLEVPRDTVRVIVSEVPKTHWGIGGRSAESLGR